MASWFERGRPAIFEALTNVCEAIDRDLHAELQHGKTLLKDASTLTEFNDAGEKKFTVVDNLEQENTKLRAQLAAMTSSSISVPTDFTQHHEADSSSQPVPASSIEHFQPLPTSSATYIASNYSKSEKSELAKLQLRFNALSDNFKKAKEALQRRKDERDKWIERATLLEKKLRAVEDEQGIRILDRSNRGGQDGRHNASFTSDVEISPSEIALPPLISTTSAANNHEVRAEDPLLQSTQSEPDEESEVLPQLPAHDRYHVVPSAKQESSSDTPVIVSERVLKKRKLNDHGHAAVGTGRVKVEQTDSSPHPTMERYGLHAQESIDLDDIAQKMQTPRKRKEIEDALERDEASRQAVLSLTPTRLFVRPDQPQQSAKVVRETHVLTPISGNKRRIDKLVSDKSKTPALKCGLSNGISVLAGDGGFYGRGAFAIKDKDTNTPNSVIKGRLDNLLHSPTPENRSTIPRPSQGLRPRVDSSQDKLLIPDRRELPFDKSARQENKRPGMDPNLTPWQKTPDQRTPVPDKSPQRNKGSGSALRRKPHSELRLDDFKINPMANDGHDFAFSEVVRDKGDRACLRGCTDIHCCGKQFRALALSQRPNPPLTAAQRQEEQKLLESYLGDYSYQLSAMNKAERAELWLEAKTEELANKYGKHRHRFSRMQSPPGFWNADFPDTQELEAEREEASKREKHVIAERYREAVRPGGRWLFRDE